MFAATSGSVMVFGNSVATALNLRSVGHVGRPREGLSAALGQFLGQRLDAVRAPRPEHDGRALRSEHSGGRLAQTAARARDDDDFAGDVFTHG